MRLIKLLKLIQFAGLVALLFSLTATLSASTPILTFVQSQYPLCCGEGIVNDLNGISDLVVSPDNKHVYTISQGDALAVFSRNPTTGALTFVTFYRDQNDGLEGLDRPSAIALSPDGKYLYVAGGIDHVVAVFSRNSDSGLLTFVEVHLDGQNGVEGLNGASLITVSPDGEHLYVASGFDSTLGVFSRDPTTGVLTFVEVQSNVDNFNGATDVIISSDGKYLYVGTNPFDNDLDDSIAVFSRDPTTGALTFVEIQYDGQNGVEGLDGSKKLTISPDGQYLYVTNRDDDALVVFSRNATTGALAFVEVHYDNQDGVDGLEEGSGVTVSPDGQYLYVTSDDDAEVAVFSRNPTTGRLAIVDVLKNGPDGVVGLPATELSSSPDGQHLYVASSEEDAVVVFSRNPTSGNLTFVEVLEDEIDGFNKLTISPDGQYVYAVARHANLLVLLSRASATGLLTYVESYEPGQFGLGISWSERMLVSPDGQHLYIGLSDDLVVFRRSPTTGQLTFVEVNDSDGLGAALPLTISPDGQHLYALSPGAVAVFSRNSTTGSLTFIEVYKDDQDGLDGLDRVESLAVSPDGEHLYVAARTDDSVALFDRDPTTGRLTFVEVYKDGQSGVDGLNGAYSVTVSPDGKQVYVAALYDDGVAVFDREPTTGELTFVQVHKNGQAGVESMDAAASVIMSPNGRYLYVAARQDDAVTVFSRDETTGQLTLAEVYKNGQNGVEGLNGAGQVAMSPKGRHLYVVGPVDEAVALFRDPTIPLTEEPQPIFLPLVLKAPPTGALQFSNATGNPVTVTLVGYATQTFPATIGPHVWSGIPPATYEWEATGTCDGNTGTVGSTQPPSSPDYREPVTILANQTIPLNQERGGQFSCAE